MASIICHHKGRYNIYSTISDGFIWTESINLEQLEEYIKEELGNKGLKDLPSRLKRAHGHGHSSIPYCSLGNFLCCNRAGAAEVHLTTQECIERFLT